MDDLLDRYKKILKNVVRSKFPKLDSKDDLYSGIFLPIAFDEYGSSPIKVMLVGRETAGWNTKNKQNSLNRVFEANEADNINWIICEAISRYKCHFKKSPEGKIITKSRSRFMQYFFRISNELSIPSKSVIYANLFAWDYDGLSPLTRSNTKTSRPLDDNNNDEFNTITSISNELLATQIKHFEPKFIVFAAGVNKIDPIIKRMFNEHFEGYETNVPAKIPGKLWEFEAAGAKCFRIAHPRAMKGHQGFRDEVIRRINSYILADKNLKEPPAKIMS